MFSFHSPSLNDAWRATLLPFSWFFSITAPLSDNDGNGRRSLLRGNVKTRRVLWQIAVKIPANPNVTKLERSCYAAAHVRKIERCVCGASRLFQCKTRPKRVGADFSRAPQAEGLSPPRNNFPTASTAIEAIELAGRLVIASQFSYPL